MIASRSVSSASESITLRGRLTEFDSLPKGGSERDSLAALPGYISNHVPRSGASFSADFGGCAGVPLRRLAMTACGRRGRDVGGANQNPAMVAPQSALMLAAPEKARDRRDIPVIEVRIKRRHQDVRHHDLHEERVAVRGCHEQHQSQACRLRRIDLDDELSSKSIRQRLCADAGGVRRARLLMVSPASRANLARRRPETPLSARADFRDRLF